MTEKHIVLTEDQLRAIVKEGVRETLMMLGADVENPLEMQRDFQHLREWRRTTSTIKDKGTMAVIGVLLAGGMAAIWVGLKEAIHR